MLYQSLVEFLRVSLCMGLVTIVKIMVIIYPVWQTLIKYTGAMLKGSKEELDMAFAPKGAPRTRQTVLEVETM